MELYDFMMGATRHRLCELNGPIGLAGPGWHVQYDLLSCFEEGLQSFQIRVQSRLWSNSRRFLRRYNPLRQTRDKGCEGTCGSIPFINAAEGPVWPEEVGEGSSKKALKVWLLDSNRLDVSEEPNVFPHVLPPEFVGECLSNLQRNVIRQDDRDRPEVQWIPFHDEHGQVAGLHGFDFDMLPAFRSRNENRPVRLNRSDDGREGRGASQDA